MAVVNSLQMLKTVIMDFSVIKPHFPIIFLGRLTAKPQFSPA